VRNSFRGQMNTNTAVPQVQFIPAAPQTVFFDESQFDRRRTKAMTADTHIAWSDFDKMHIAHHVEQRCKRHIAPFAFSNTKLARTIALATWQRSNGGQKPMPEDISYLELRAMAHATTNKRRAKDISHMPERQQAILERMHIALHTAGGFMELMSQIAYRSWRLGQESVVIAEALNCTPPQVRHILVRLKKVARKLGFDAPVTAAPGSIVKPKRSCGRFKWTERLVQRAQALRAAGSTLAAIAHALGAGRPQCVRQKLLAAKQSPAKFQRGSIQRQG
jgi:hypothetical protein